MSSENENKRRGFSGLDSMLSDIKIPAVVEPTKSRRPVQSLPEPPRKVPTTAQPAYSAPSPTRGGSGKWWLIGIGLLVIFVWASGSDKKPSANTVPTASSYTYSPPPQTTPNYNPNPVQPMSSTEEEIPPVGNGLTFNRAQIRYCLSEKIRMSAWQAKVNQYSENSVDAFNMAVNDYNMRCSHFRYRSGMLESVRAEVESNRYALQLEGMRSAAANP